MMKWSMKGLCALFVCAMTGAVCLAQAFVVLTPGGSGPTGNYSDANGKIEMRRGVDATWADGSGRMRAIDPTAIKASRGSAIDNKRCTGVIPEAINPSWIWGIGSKMTVSSGGYMGANFTNKIEARGRGELAIWGDGGPVYAAAEVTTTNQHAPGRYDIDIVVDGVTYTISDGGSYHKLSNPLGEGGGYREISAAQGFQTFAADWRLDYESRASGLMEIDFAAAGRESVNFNIGQVDGQWRGQVSAWDFGPFGPIPLGSWVLD